MHLPDMPNQVDWEDVDRALKSLGITTTALDEAIFSDGQIELTYLRTDKSGRTIQGSYEDLSRVGITIYVKPPNIAS